LEDEDALLAAPLAKLKALEQKRIGLTE